MHVSGAAEGHMTESDHIVKSYNEQLRLLKSNATRMGRLALEQLQDALDAVERSDSSPAHRVIEREPQANHMEHEIDELALRVLALRQPVAVDLRAVLSALRIANELERICDYAVDLAERSLTLRNDGREQMPSFIAFGRYAAKMVGDALAAFENGDDQQAEGVWNRDKDLDAMYTALFRDLVKRMIDNPDKISVATQLLFMARGIERTGDRATNIAEDVLYLVRGTLPEDERPKGDATRRILLRKPS